MPAIAKCLRASVLLASMLFILTCGFSQTPEIGLELYSLRAQFAKDVPGTMAKVKQMGIREVEFGGTYGLSVDGLKKLLKQNNLTVPSYGTDFKELTDSLQNIISMAKAFGSKYVVVFWIPHKGEFTADDAKKAIELFNSAGKKLHENGLSLCYHAHGYEFAAYEDGTLFDYMAKNLDPKYANFEIDVFWVKQPGHDPVALLKKYPNRFPLMHLKDRKPGTPDSQNGEADVESNVVLGAGDVGIEAIMREAKRIGVKHFFIEDESSRSEEQIPESLKFLKGIKY